ncbi:LysE family translocator [Ancylobacter polymorphus]|uniref:LysE family translocator n=1 Tax=Ancylobacter polymorphus TaxID=223390 RepID=A0A9E7CWM4_9HYPH|nr:LysE family translocator [Ancylobacter polymorphus]UOK71229.1 LysE family translocator [Ancylobacter polymorphus]
MPRTDLFLAFLATAGLFACIPGPAMLYTAAQTLARGRLSGVMAVLGLHLGCYAHVIAAAGGLSVLFHAVPLLYMAVKLVGAAYLIWLGIGMFRAKSKGEALALSAPGRKSSRRAFVESVAVEVLNPKTALFFVALLPQFIDPAASLPVWAQFLVLGTLVNVMFTTAYLVCVLLAGAMVERLRRSSRAQQMMHRAGGAVLVGLGTHLALQRH